MNTMFFLMMTSSLILIAITAPELAYNAMLDGATASLKLACSLIAIYAIWLSVLRIIEQVGLNKIIYKMFKPLTSRLFKGETEQTQMLITLNFSANLLGMGGVATPLGIKAMRAMQDGSTRATANMILFMTINATSIQLLPTTIIGLRAASGSIAPSNIILPSLLATFLTTIIGITLCKICGISSKKTTPNSQSLSCASKQNALLTAKTLSNSKNSNSQSLSCASQPNALPISKLSINKKIAPSRKTIFKGRRAR
ncbi:MAG: hypothetical protein RR348_02920 [Clostridia bacterium]